MCVKAQETALILYIKNGTKFTFRAYIFALHGPPAYCLAIVPACGGGGGEGGTGAFMLAASLSDTGA